MIGNEDIALAVTGAIFLLFAVGFVVTYQGIVGRDVDLFSDVWGKRSNRWGPIATARSTRRIGMV